MKTNAKKPVDTLQKKVLALIIASGKMHRNMNLFSKPEYSKVGLDTRLTQEETL